MVCQQNSIKQLLHVDLESRNMEREVTDVKENQKICLLLNMTYFLLTYNKLGTFTSFTSFLKPKFHSVVVSRCNIKAAESVD